MYGLGIYYYQEEKEYSEAKKWFAAAAEAGVPAGMSLAALSTAMVARATRMTFGNDAWVLDECIRDNTEAVKWARMAQENGQEDPGEASMISELGACYYHASFLGDRDHSEMLQMARSTLEPYCSQLDFEGKMYLAFTLHDILTDGETSGVPADDGDARKMVSLLEECSLQTEESVPHLSAVFAYLGASYLLGEGCARDFDKAHDAFVKANELGFDCSNHLSRFKKKLFGGWDYKF